MAQLHIKLDKLTACGCRVKERVLSASAVEATNPGVNEGTTCLGMWT